MCSDAYRQIIDLNYGKVPNVVRSFQVQFETENYDETINSRQGWFNDEIVFACIPNPLMPDPNDQNLITFFSLRPSDITSKGISIPINDNGRDTEQRLWSQIMQLYYPVEF